MRALFLSYSHNTLGGIEVWLDGLARFLRGRGHEVVIGLARGERFNTPARFRETWPGHDYVEIDGRTGTHEGRIRAVTRTVSRVAPDVLIPVTIGHALPAAGRLKASGRKLRVVLPLHATHPMLLREALAFAPVLDCCVGVNPLHAEALAQYGFPRERLATVINGAEPPSRDVVRNRQPGEPLRILFAGRLDEPTKRIFDLVPLAAALDRMGIPFSVTVAGDGPDAAELRRRVDEANLAERFAFLGRVDHVTLRDSIYAQHDVLIILSPPLGEAGPPLVALEAMASGTVVVSSEFVGVHAPGSIEEGRTALLFPPGDVERAAARIAELWTDTELWRRLSDAAKERAREYTLARSWQNWETVLLRTAAAPPHVPDRPFPFETPDRTSGTLDRLPLPAGMIDRLRFALRRFPSFPNGWGEWPGTITPPGFPVPEIDVEELARLDRSLAITPSPE